MTGLLHRLSTSRPVLFAALLLLNGIFRPYAGLVHDSRLYAVQTLDRVTPGIYSSDLYLRYGSQDQYSVFSLVAAPVVNWLGLETAFFLLYLLSNAFFLYALLRFVRAVVKPPGLATLALIFLVVNPIPFGGLGVFNVHENFLTPRLVANALVLLGLERMLRGNSRISFALLAVALLVHPIMAFGGLLTYLAWHLFTRCNRREMIVVASAGGLAAMMLLTCVPLATLVFGYMDPAWRDAVHAVNAYSIPGRWTGNDWYRICVAFGLVAAARTFAPPHQRVRALLDAVFAVGIVGMSFGCIAAWLPYALLFQGQPYRALWLLQVAATVSVFMLAGRLHSSHKHSRVTARLGILAFAASTLSWLHALCAVLLVGVAHLRARFDKNRFAMFVSVPAVAVVATVLAGSLAATVYACRSLSYFVPPAMCFQNVATSTGPLFTWMLAIGVLLGLQALLPTPRRFCGAAVATSLAVQVSLLVVPYSPLAESWNLYGASDVGFVKRYLQSRKESCPGVPTVYWSAGKLDDIWFSLECRSFYTVEQTVGNMFNRGTAMEGERRVAIARPFDLATWATMPYPLSRWKRRWLKRIYGQEVGSTTPRLEHLHRLCRESTLDVAVLPQKFEGWYACRHGRWFVYDCAAIRSALARQAAASPVCQQRAHPAAATDDSCDSD